MRSPTPIARLPVSDRHNFPKMALRQRDGTPWDGHWMGAFCWRRTDGPWANLPGGPLLDEHWLELTPNFVLTAFLSTAYAGLVDAGVVVAWLHHAAAFSNARGSARAGSPLRLSNSVRRRRPKIRSPRMCWRRRRSAEPARASAQRFDDLHEALNPIGVDRIPSHAADLEVGADDRAVGSRTKTRNSLAL